MLREVYDFGFTQTKSDGALLHLNPAPVREPLCHMKHLQSPNHRSTLIPVMLCSPSGFLARFHLHFSLLHLARFRTL